MLRIGPFVLTTRRGLARHDLALLERLPDHTKQAKQQDAVIARQHDLVVQAEADRNVAQAAVMEGCELLREQQDELDRLHPVSQPPAEGDA